MSIQKCKECGNEVSTKAEACPKCGAKQPRTSGCMKVFLITFGILFGLFVIGTLTNKTDKSATPNNISDTNENSEMQSKSQSVIPSIDSNSESQWSYERSEDPMSNGVTYFAIIQSTNSVEFSFPYSGQQKATLTLRSHPRHGKDIIFKIEKGQILCTSYEDCTILIRFDDQKAQSYSAIGASDNSTETIFIRNYSRFVSNMQKSKNVRIAAEIYQEGTPVFEFDVRGFDASKYNIK